MLGEAIDKLGARLKPPPWLVDEVQQRLVLLLNHVLMQEPEAQQRLRRQKGRVVAVRWRDFTLGLAVTPAGLFERVADEPADAPTRLEPDLHLVVTDSSPLALARAAARGDKPAVRIEGDVQFAAEINWLVDNLRWDVEDDLARLMGDAPAHALGRAARSAAAALRRFAGVLARGDGPASGGPSPL